jgi:hypothetical protein
MKKEHTKKKQESKIKMVMDKLFQIGELYIKEKNEPQIAPLQTEFRNAVMTPKINQLTAMIYMYLQVMSPVEI